MIFSKSSTRTRCAFEVAMHDQGGHVTYLDSAGSHIGRTESLKDTLAELEQAGTRPTFRRYGRTMSFGRSAARRPRNRQA